MPPKKTMVMLICPKCNGLRLTNNKTGYLANFCHLCGYKYVKSNIKGD